MNGGRGDGIKGIAWVQDSRLARGSFVIASAAAHPRRRERWRCRSMGARF